MNKKSLYQAKIVLFTVFLVILDQISKLLATTYLKPQNDLIIIKNVFCLHYLDGGNTGAAWGIFSGKRLIFVIFTIIAIAFIGVFIKNTINLFVSTNNTIYKVLSLFLALLMSGAFGNLIDRVVHGYVIDFIYFELINFPIFNVADCYVTISCIGIIFICLFKVKEEDFNKIISIKRSK